MEATVIGYILTFCVRYNENSLSMLSCRQCLKLEIYCLTLFLTDAPVFRIENYTEELNPGENVTFECHAEGNPPPEVRWQYTPTVNVMETTGGRQKNISITGATSTNVGVYFCVATNKVGQVTRSVTLMMTGIIIECVLH